jgi:ketosteroid isomerase-like protein
VRYQGLVQRLLLIPFILAMTLAAATPEEEVRAAEKAWSEAVIKRDVAALERTFSEDLIYAHSTGNIETRDEYMVRLKAGKQRYDTMTYEKTKVTVHGNSVVLHAITRFTGKNDSGAFNDHLMMIHFWVKKGKDWRLVAHQTTRIP